MKINKNILLYDLALFVFGLLSLIGVKILINTGIATPENYVLNVIVAILMIALLVINIFVINKKINGSVGVVNIAIPLILLFSYYIIYALPVFGFFEYKGINNNVGMTFLFLVGTRFYYNLSLLFKSRSRAEGYKINKNALNYTKNYNKIFAYFANYILVLVIVLVIINTMYNIIDMSAFYP